MVYIVSGNNVQIICQGKVMGKIGSLQRLASHVIFAA
jgi:hypothetical protein